MSRFFVKKVPIRSDPYENNDRNPKAILNERAQQFRYSVTYTSVLGKSVKPTYTSTCTLYDKDSPTLQEHDGVGIAAEFSEKFTILNVPGGAKNAERILAQYIIDNVPPFNLQNTRIYPAESPVICTNGTSTNTVMKAQALLDSIVNENPEKEFDDACNLLRNMLEACELQRLKVENLLRICQEQKITKNKSSDHDSATHNSESILTECVAPRS